MSLLCLPDELLVMICSRLNVKGGNIAVLRAVCRRLRAVVQSMMDQRAARIDRMLAVANAWQQRCLAASLPGKLAVIGPVCFWLASFRRNPMLPWNVNVIYLGGPGDLVPHPTRDGELAPAWSEMADTGHGSRAAGIEGLSFLRFLRCNEETTLREYLQGLAPSFHCFGYTTPGQIEYHPWTCHARDDYYNTVYVDEDVSNEPYFITVRKSGFKICVV
jgi:hypothetical protein